MGLFLGILFCVLQLYIIYKVIFKKAKYNSFYDDVIKGKNRW